MDNLTLYVVIVGGILSIIVTYIAAGEYIIRLFKIIFKKEKYCKQISTKILDWFNFIDKNLTDHGINIEEVNSLEKEVDFLFKMHNCNKVVMNFNIKFIKNYLKYCGLQSKYRTKEQFLKYAHIRHEKLDLILALSSNHHKKKFSQFNILFVDYWLIIRGNFHIYYSQYIKNYQDIPEDKQLTIADIEMPVKVIRMYFKQY
jgi:hypothetical protein